MAQDLMLTDSGYNGYDISVGPNGDLETIDGYDTAVWVSLFTDARASSEQVSAPERRRGWVGNTVSPIADRQLGGLLWLIDQRRLTQRTLNEAVDYARLSLMWLVEDGIASDISVTGRIVPKYGIELDITLTAQDGGVSKRNLRLWEVTGR